jgi:hypothetical protein
MRSRKILTLTISLLIFLFLVASLPISANGSAMGDMGTDETLEPITFLPVIFNGCPHFFDDFSNPASGWSVGEDDDIRTEYLNGEYRTLTKNNRNMYFFSAPTCDRVNYVVEVDARWEGIPGASYGLIFGITGNTPDEFYLFHVNTAFMEYELLRFDDGHRIVPRSFSGAIKAGTDSNHLKVIRNGDQITLEVNGEVLGTVTDDKFTGMTGVGILTNPYRGEPTSDVRYDNFSVMGLPSSSRVVQDRYADTSSMSNFSSPSWKQSAMLNGDNWKGDE